MDLNDDRPPLRPEALAALVWDTSLAAVMVVDPATHTIVDINRVGLELMGRSRGEVVGSLCHNYVCPAEVGKCPITDLGHTVDHSERTLLGAGGRRVPILKTVNEVVLDGRRLLVESFVNITTLKETEKALEESRRFIQTVVDGIGDPVLVIKPEDHRILLANRAALDQNGGQDPAALGLTCYQLSHHRNRPCGEVEGPCPLREVAATKGPVRVTHRHRTERGEIVVDVFATPVLGADGSVTAVIESNRDITLHKQAEETIRRVKEELERQNAELRKVDRMKDAFLSDVSHELKTPVAKQAMQIEILARKLRQCGVFEELHEVVEAMESGVRRQQSVIRNVLMLSRLESGGKQFRRDPIRVDGLLEEIIADYLHLLTSLGITLDVALTEAVVIADREMLWHVFSNVVNNAIKYRGESEPRIAVRIASGGGTVMVTIADNGVGMAPAEVNHAFERFYQASSSMEGIGVGLTISQVILERLGGAIRLESAGRGAGTTVTVTLPAAG